MNQRSAIIVLLVVALAGAAWWLLSSRGEDPAPAEGRAAPSSVSDPPSGKKRAAASGDRSPTTARLQGRTLLADKDDAPIAGAIVALRRHDLERGEAPTLVRSAAGGNFTFEDVAAGKYSVSATLPGYLPAVVSSIEIGGEPPAPLDLRLAPGGHRLYGSVGDVTGGTVSEAFVRVVPRSGFAALREHEGFATIATDDGAYALHLPPGRYRVEVGHPDYADARRTIEIGAGDLEQNFELVPTASVSGVVVEAASGRAVAGATVAWKREKLMVLPGGQRTTVHAGGGSVVADNAGRFTIRGVEAGELLLSARAVGRASKDRTSVTVAIAEQVTEVRVPVVTAFDVSGTVVDKRDPERGIGGARIELSARGEPGASARTDAEGRFILEGVLAGSYTMLSSASGYESNFPPPTLDVQASQADVRIELDPGLRIRGRVDPPQVAEVRVELDPSSLDMRGGMILATGGGSTQSEADGTFELGPVREGKATLVARAADGSSGRLEVDIGAEGLDDAVVVLEPRATVAGVVTDTRGEPVSQALVTLRPVGRSNATLVVNGREMGADAAATADDGSFEIVGVEPGEYQLRVSDRYGGERTITDEASRSLKVEARDLTGLALVIESHDGTIRGIVKYDDGAPATDVWVTLAGSPGFGDIDPPSAKGGDDGPQERREMRMIVAADEGGIAPGTRPPTLTDEDGRFEFGALADGEYELHAQVDGGGSRASASARPDADVTLTLAPLGEVSGTVTMNGEPLRSYLVNLSGPSPRTKRVRDSGGTYHLERLDPGRYTIVVSADGGSGRAEFTIEAGGSVDRDVVLEELVKVTGRVVDEEGNPVVGAMMLLGDMPDDGAVSISHEGTGDFPMTDEDGKFEVKCAAGRRIVLALQPGKGAPSAMKVFVAEPGEDVDLGTLKPGGMAGMMGGPGMAVEAEVETNAAP